MPETEKSGSIYDEVTAPVAILFLHGVSGSYFNGWRLKHLPSSARLCTCELPRISTLEINTMQNTLLQRTRNISCTSF